MRGKFHGQIRGDDAMTSGNSLSIGNKGAWIAFGRIFMGLFWLYEIILGHNWKIGHPGWMGAGAGDWLREDLLSAFDYGTWGWFHAMAESVMMPQAVLMSYIVTFLQLIIALSFIFGVFARPIAAAGIFMVPVMFLTGHSRIPPFFMLGHIFVLGANAGMYYGFDSCLFKKLSEVKGKAAGLICRLITLDFIGLNFAKLFFPLFAFAGVYFLLNTPVMPAVQIRMSSLALAVFSGLSAAYLYFLLKGADNIALLSRGLQLFIGFKFLHEIWVRFPAALNGLPGWSTGEELNEVFAFIAGNHWSFMGGIVNSAFIPFGNLWAFIFAVVQTAVGIMLLFGVKTRLASGAGIVYLGLLILLGFTRYTPFVLGFLILAAGLESGARLPRLAAPFFGALFVLFTVIAFAGGIIPGDYREQMGPVAAIMVALISLPLFVTAYVQNRPEKIS